jgi:hypothetical protein
MQVEPGLSSPDSGSDDDLSHMNAAQPEQIPNSPIIHWKEGLDNIRNSLNEMPFRALRPFLFNKSPHGDLPLARIGLQYTPDPPNEERDMRTVKIIGLPSHTEISHVLPHVHGGPILSATMCDTISLTGSMTALITFVEAQGADAFVRAAETDGFYIGFKPYEVELIRSATYPMPALMEELINRRGGSRILAISHRQKKTDLKRRVYEALSEISGRVENFGKETRPGEVIVRFVSIEAASFARDILQLDANTRKCTVKFVPDD